MPLSSTLSTYNLSYNLTKYQLQIHNISYKTYKNVTKKIKLDKIMVKKCQIIDYNQQLDRIYNMNITANNQKESKVQTRTTKEENKVKIKTVKHGEFITAIVSEMGSKNETPAFSVSLYEADKTLKSGFRFFAKLQGWTPPRLACLKAVACAYPDAIYGRPHICNLCK